MKAAVYDGKQKIEVREVSKPSIGSNDVLLRVRSVGICGTDLHIYNGGTTVKPGTVIGHEFSGEIAEIGANVTGLNVGDHAVAEHVVRCKACYYCLRGKPELCLNSQVIGMDRPGGLAEYVALPADLVFPIPQKMNFDEAALIEPLTIALYAAAQAGFLTEKRVAVIGQGPIGILLDQVLQAGGARVIGVDVLPARLQFAKKHGWVHEVLNPQDKKFQSQLDEISAIGVDASFEAVGRESTAKLAMDITRRDGDIFLLGVFEKPATLDLMSIIKKELNVFGSWTCAFSFPAAIDLVAQKKVDLKSLITHTYKLKDVSKAFKEASAYSQNRIKTVIRI